MLNGIKYQEIDKLIDSYLDRMFDPSSEISESQKKEIKSHCMKLSGFFTEIIAGYNAYSISPVYFDNILDRIEMFVMAYRSTLNSLQNRYLAVCVGSIWYELFVSLEKELQHKIIDKVVFRHAIDEINKILLERTKKQPGS